METIELTTPRLRLRQWRDSDRDPFATMNADPVVMDCSAGKNSAAQALPVQSHARAVRWPGEVS
jgi:RimJ/RimL family protein N-acetyltransferase